MNEVYEFLKSCGVYYLATDEDGQPRVRPFGTVICLTAGCTSRREKARPWPGRWRPTPK